MGVTYITPANIEVERFAKKEDVDSFAQKSNNEIKEIKVEILKLNHMTKNRRYYNFRTRDIKKHIH